MAERTFFESELRKVQWTEGLHLQIAQTSYRHATVVVCSTRGRQKAIFANGEFPYFAYLELLDSKGNWIICGNNVVPVLPDGRFIMVVEQRPTLERYENRPDRIELERRSLKLSSYDSLEFPGGAIEPGESFTAGFLRELREESGVENQKAVLFRRVRPVYPFGSDLALAMFYSVIFLSGFGFSDYVDDDGGLKVLALTRDEVQNNIWNGVIASGQAAVAGWSFFKEVKTVIGSSYLHHKLTASGYLSEEEVNIIKPK